MAADFYVYVHMKPDLTPFYVGKGRGRRAFQLDRPRNPHHTNIIRKYGRSNILVETMVCKNEAEAFFREILTIRSLRGAGVKLTNVTNGGDGVSGLKHSKETKQKLSAMARGKPGHKHSVETKQHLSKVNTGKKHSEETRRKLSEVQVGQIRGPCSEETKKKLSVANKGQGLGRKLPDEVRIKISSTMTGNISEEHKRAISLAHTGKIISEETRARMSFARKEYYRHKKGNEKC